MRSNAQRIEHTRQTTATAHRPVCRTLEGWALGILLEAHAVTQCHEHGHMRDRTDPHAWDHARDIARQEPFPGTSPDKAVAAVDEVMRSIGDTCPECQ